MFQSQMLHVQCLSLLHRPLRLAPSARQVQRHAERYAEVLQERRVRAQRVRATSAACPPKLLIMCCEHKCRWAPIGRDPHWQCVECLEFYDFSTPRIRDHMRNGLVPTCEAHGRCTYQIFMGSSRNRFRCTIQQSPLEQPSDLYCDLPVVFESDIPADRDASLPEL